MKTGRIMNRSGEAGRAREGKGRIVYLGKSARRFIWRYLVERDDANGPESPLFIGKSHLPFNRDALRQLIKGLGTKAGVMKCHPYRFRHTFAITYLRSGG